MIEKYYTKSAKEHLNVPENPQSYLQHCIFAMVNSSILIFAGILGVIHAIIPNLFPFVTSEIVAKSCKKMIQSNRHKPELREHLSKYIKDEYL